MSAVRVVVFSEELDLEDFTEAIERADLLEVTELDLEVEGDTFAPDRSGWDVARIDPADGWTVSRTGVPYRVLTLIRP